MQTYAAGAKHTLHRIFCQQAQKNNSIKPNPTNADETQTKKSFQNQNLAKNISRFR